MVVSERGKSKSKVTPNEEKEGKSEILKEEKEEDEEESLGIKKEEDEEENRVSRDGEKDKRNNKGIVQREGGGRARRKTNRKNFAGVLKKKEMIERVKEDKQKVWKMEEKKVKAKRKLASLMKTKNLNRKTR